MPAPARVVSRTSCSEYIDGLPIDAFADEHQLTVADRIKLVVDVLAGVAHAHANLIVHRDLKPSNILVTRDGTPKLLDFGIAKLLAYEERDRMVTLAADGRALTPEYAAPEQVRGEPSVVATDVYSVGVSSTCCSQAHGRTISRAVQLPTSSVSSASACR